MGTRPSVNMKYHEHLRDGLRGLVEPSKNVHQVASIERRLDYQLNDAVSTPQDNDQFEMREVHILDYHTPFP